MFNTFINKDFCLKLKKTEKTLTVLILVVGVALREIVVQQAFGQSRRRVQTVDGHAAVLRGQHFVGLLIGQLLQRGGLLLADGLQRAHLLDLGLNDVDHSTASLIVDLDRLLLDDGSLGLKFLDSGQQRLVDVLNGTVELLDQWGGCVHGHVNGILGGAKGPSEDSVVAYGSVQTMFAK